MDRNVPYVEASVGIYNIFKLLHVEYVHRFTYRDNPGINKNGNPLHGINGILKNYATTSRTVTAKDFG